MKLLVLAGHDPTGGAGIDADREAARRFGADALCVVTAWTRQAEGRVLALGARPVAEWVADARAALDAPAAALPAALKTGLLPGAEHVRAAAALVRGLRERGAAPPVVVDPVLAASGGEPFLDDEGVRALDELLAGAVVTPNLPEAARLTGHPLAALAADPDLRAEAARALLARGAAGVVLKGGHGREDPVRDLVLEPGRPPCWHAHARVPGVDLHGSGCRHATALAARLAAGDGLLAAAEAAGRFLAERIAALADAR